MSNGVPDALRLSPRQAFALRSHIIRQQARDSIRTLTMNRAARAEKAAPFNKTLKALQKEAGDGDKD